MSSTAADGSGAKPHRYPGAHSFQEHEHAWFWGRGKASAELLLRVLSVPLLLQFAPSGVGKTSLLNAGLFPALRPHHYFPVIVRLNKPQEPPSEAVRRSLMEAARACGLVDPVIPAQAEQLRPLLAGTQLWSAELLLLTPVLVFDQFEEIFTLQDENYRKQFAAELASLRAAPDAADLASAPPAVKIILSLREEYLGQMEQFSASIPDLFRERLRLAPLNPAEATEAMIEPARAPGDGWASPPFEYEPACLDALLDFIDGTSDSHKLIEALTLQLVCQRAEAIATQRAPGADGRRVLKLGDFGGPAGLERLVRSYFQDELAQLPSAKARRQAQAMFDEGLLDPGGRRLMLEQNEIKRRFGLEKALLDQLVNRSLLRREPRNESVFYEISHDRLTESIARHRRTRLPRWVWWTLAGGALGMALLSAGIVYVRQQSLAAERARDQADYALQLQLGEELIGRLRDAGLSDALKQVLQQAQAEGGAGTHLMGLAAVLKLRHEGDIEHQQGTLGRARAKYSAALQRLDALAPAATETALLKAERARLRLRLAVLLAEAGQDAEAEQAYREAVALWDAVQQGGASWQLALDAAEAHLDFAGFMDEAGDFAAADLQYFAASTLATQVWRKAFDEIQRGGSDVNFKLGRAMQVFASTALAQARLRDDEALKQRAVALAREAVRMRPSSFQARQRLGTALVSSGWRVSERQIAQGLLEEARALFNALGQNDPADRHMQRESAALQLAIAQAMIDCRAAPDCAKKLPADALDQARLAALESSGAFGWLSGLDPENRALMGAVSWGLKVQAAQLGAAGQPAKALALLEQAIAALELGSDPARRSSLRNRLWLIGLLQDKARLQRRAGQTEQALATLDQAGAELAGMPAGLLGVQYGRINVLDARLTLLRAQGQGAQADALGPERARLLAQLPKPAWEQRNAAAQALNDAAVALHAQPAGTSEAQRLQLLQQILAKHEEAAALDPFDAVLWLNLGYTRQRMAGLLSGPGAEPAPLEAARRDALTTLWMAALLSPAESKAERLQDMYEARRDLTLLLRDKNDVRMLSVVEQSVLDAKELVRSNRANSPDALFCLADANFGLAMLRDEAGNNRADAKGWREGLQVALLHGEQLAALQPANAVHQIWLGETHSYFADRLALRQQAGPADEERELGLRACREGRRLAQAASEPAAEARARTCLKKLGEP